MIITNKLKTNLQNPGATPIVHAVQNDSYSRNLEIAVMSGNHPFTFPDTVNVIIRYRKSDGRGGEYDTLPDGTSAWWIKGNLLTIALAPQVLTVPGSVVLSVTLIENEKQLSVFPIQIAVQPVAHANIAKSEDYFYVTGFLPAPISAKAGQHFQISSVNEQGRILSVEAVDLDTLSSDVVAQELQTALQAAKDSGAFDGQDGYTPRRGTDYWTKEDVAAMQDHIAKEVAGTYGKGVAISSGSDLNTYTAIGKYFASSNTLASSLINCPTTQNFMLYVFIRGNSSTSQMIIDLAGKLYIRSKSTSTWNQWVTYITKTDLTKAVQEAMEQAIENGTLTCTPGYTPVKGVDYWTETEVAEFLAYIDAAVTDTYRKGISIPSESNLNDYTDIGKYYVQTNSITATLKNSPTTQNFMMFVLERTSGTKTQIIIDLTGKMYFRSRSTSAWNSWVTYITKSDLTNAVAEAVEDALSSGEFSTHTPVKGIDYWTEADRESMIQDVIAALGTPVFGTVDENNVITLSGKLTAGTYTLVYEDAEGNTTHIGLLESGETNVAYTNLLAQATDENGALLDGVGYRNEYRFGGYGGDLYNDTSGTAGYFATGFMPYTIANLKNCIPIYIKGISLDLANLPQYLRFTVVIPGSTEYFGSLSLSDESTGGNFAITQLGKDYYRFIPDNSLYTLHDWDSKATTHMRWTLPGSGAGVVITVNEPIE